MMMKYCFLGLIFFNVSGLASYRVFQLKVTSYDEKNRVQKTNKILSSLDPYQYEHYHGGYGRMKVEMIDTWFCPGDTHSKDFCKKPKNQLLQRGPAGVIAPKRSEGRMTQPNR